MKTLSSSTPFHSFHPPQKAYLHPQEGQINDMRAWLDSPTHKEIMGVKQIPMQLRKLQEIGKI